MEQVLVRLLAHAFSQLQFAPFQLQVKVIHKTYDIHLLCLNYFNKLIIQFKLYSNYDRTRLKTVQTSPR